MIDGLSVRVVFREAWQEVGRGVVPSLPWLFLFVFASGYLGFANAGLSGTTVANLVFVAIAVTVLYAHNLYSASIYRAILPIRGTLRGNALKLTGAFLLLGLALSIIGLILVLFFSLFSLVLGWASGYESVSTEVGAANDSLRAMQESGVIWILYVLLAFALAGLIWFFARLMTFAAATVSRNQVHVFRTWGWTKGQGGRLVVILLAGIGLPLLGLVLLAEGVSALVGLPSGLAQTFTQEATLSLAQDAGAGGVSPLQEGLGTGLRTLIAAPSAWWGHALAAAVYRRLAPPVED